MRSRAEGFGPEAMRRIMLGTYALSAGYYDAYYGQAQKARTLIAQRVRAAFERLRRAAHADVAAGRVQDRREGSDPLTMYLSDIYTIPVNLAGNCAHQRAVRLRRRAGMPIGLQIIGDYFAEATVLRAAAAFEAATHFDTMPPLVRSLAGAEGGE